MCEISNMLHEMPKKHEVSVEWIADQIGCNPSSLYRQLNPHDHHPFPLKKLIPFMNACNRDYSVLDLLESRLGRIAVNFGSNDVKINLQSIAKLTKEAGEAISVLADTIKDNKIEDHERQKCIKELLDLQKITSSLLVTLNRLDCTEHSTATATESKGKVA